MIATAFAMSWLFVPAQENGEYLHIRTAGGWDVVSIEKAERITFNNNVMTITDSNNATLGTYAQNQLEAMYIDDTSGVKEVSAEGRETNFGFDASTNTMVMMKDGMVEIYSPAGALLTRLPNVKKGENVNLSGMGAGVVIIKSGNHTLKTVLK